MYIVINKNNLIPNENWMQFRKVRAIIENKNNEFAISKEGGKILFPGGKCDKEESETDAIIRELKEETGITFSINDLKQVLTLETFYKEFYDFRSDSYKPRHTVTTYYYIKTNQQINLNKQELTENELKENFNIKFASKEELIKLINEDHSNIINGQYFDEENKIILEKFF